MQKFFEALGGRSVVFAFFALGLGAILSYFGKMNSEFVALIGVLQTLVVVRAVAQDKYINGHAKPPATSGAPTP
jgi:hypothetical protein